MDYSRTSEMAWYQYLNARPSYGAITERDEAALFAQCVESQVLKAPASAVFPTFDQMIVNGSNGRYSVSGYVDSQNSYGAMIRSQYTYNVEKDYTGVWRCTDNFVSTSSQINKSIIGSTIVWWILGIVGTALTFAITSCQISNMF